LSNQGKFIKIIFLFLGYSGWEANQLRNEMEANSWMKVPRTVIKTRLSENLNLFLEEKNFTRIGAIAFDSVNKATG
jgi:putative AlgH/UPF0301 family transcriptional regulator